MTTDHASVPACIVHITRPNRAPRTGFILPSVVVAILLVAMLAAALQTAALRADVQARLGFAGEHALHAADAALAQQINAWNPREFAAMPIGTRNTTAPLDAQGLTANVTLVRTGALAAWIEVDVNNKIDGNTLAAHRRIARFITVESPQLPQRAALTSLGRITLDDPTQINGADQTPPNWTPDCNGTAPAANITANASTSFASATPANAVIVRDSIAARAQFDAAWNEWVARATTTQLATSPVTLTPDDAGGICTPASGDPLRDASASAACIHEYSAKLVTTNTTVTFTGHSRFQGVLLIDGDTNIDGDLLLNGMLVVRGALHTEAGRLTVNGTLLIRDNANHTSRVGIASHIQYSRCATYRALAGLGKPTTRTLHSWFERP